ncbi:MAG: hypothetical protein CVU97_06845 [Firmicutes bacterium HGW-Firmicutes-21]|nr:MAG: hypothetical protein CVU97_06845 [Firmicutes bacterium HGW-Firmicutes-21]
MYCHNCGKELGNDDNFCNNCGEKAIQPETFIPTSEDDEAEEITPIQENEPLPIIEPEIIPEEAEPDEVVADEETLSDDTISDVSILSNETEHSEDSVADGQTPPVMDEVEEHNETIQGEYTESPPIIFVNDAEQAEEPDLIITENEARKEQRTPRSSSVKITTTVCSVFLSLLIGIMLIALVGQVIIRTGLTEQRITAALRSIDYNNDKIKGVLDINALSEKYDTEIPENATIAEIIYYCIDQDEFINPISKDEVARLIERLNFEKFIAERAVKAVDVLRRGSDEQIVSPKEIIDFLREDKNKAIIEKTIGIRILEIDFAYMEKQLEEKNQGCFNVFSENGFYDRHDKAGYKFARFIFTDWFMLILCVMIVVVAIAIGFIKKRFSSSLLYTGVSFVVVGVPLLLVCLLYKVILRASDSIPAEFIINITSPIISVLTVIFAVTAASGAVLIITGIIVRAFSKRRNRYNPAKQY